MQQSASYTLLDVVEKLRSISRPVATAEHWAMLPIFCALLHQLNVYILSSYQNLNPCTTQVYICDIHETVTNAL